MPITVVVALIASGAKAALVSGTLVGIGTVILDTWIERNGRVDKTR